MVKQTLHSGAAALLLLAAASGCAGSAGGTTRDVPAASGPVTTLTAAGIPGGPHAGGAGRVGGIDPAEAPASGLAIPAGPHPSFNESAGCGSSQGFRGPFVPEAGYQADHVEIAGPWGDYFGRDIGEVRSHLVLMELPTVGGRADNKVWVHERVAPALQRVIDGLLERRLMGYSYRIEVTSSFRPSTVPPNRYLSFHAVGAAIDINPDANPYRDDNVLVTDMPAWFVQVWRDAGWCWGGDWEDIKDPMHFSWRGPLHTDAYPALAPFEPRTGESPFLRSITFTTRLGATPPGATQLIADVDRDGSPDAIRISAWTQSGRLGVEAARAQHAYSTCWTAGVTQTPAGPASTLLLADGTGDGRPDLWEVGPTGDTGVGVLVHTFASGYRSALRPAVVPTDAAPGAVYLTGDHDRDGAVDLYVIEPGDPVRIEVLAAPTFRPIVNAIIPLAASAAWQFALGDYDGDGIPDLYAVGPGDPAAVAISSGADRFAGDPVLLDTGVARHTGRPQAADVDGDGRDDLVFFDDDGTVTAYFGGDTGETGDDELISWFFAGSSEPWADGRPWDPGDGCRTVPGRPVRD